MLTVVLLTGVILTLATTTYLWGSKMIQKEKDQRRVEGMESFMKNLNQKIVQVANQGGRKEIKTNLQGTLEIMDPGNNTPSNLDNITLTFQTQGLQVATGKTIELVGEGGATGPMTQEPGVLTVYSENLDGVYQVTMKLYYKTLTSAAGQNYRIDISNLGRSKIGKREATFVIEEGKTIHNPDVTINRVNVRVI